MPWRGDQPQRKSMTTTVQDCLKNFKTFMTGPVTVIGGDDTQSFHYGRWCKRTCVKRLTPSDPGKGCGVKCGRGRLCKSHGIRIECHYITRMSVDFLELTLDNEPWMFRKLTIGGDGRLEGASARFSSVWTDVMRRETLNAMVVKCSSFECCINLQAFFLLLLCEAFTTALLSTKTQWLPLSLRYHM